MLLALNNPQLTAPASVDFNRTTVAQHAILPDKLAQAPRFALTCIGTETGYTITFSYRWGSGRWVDSSVSPGKWRPLRWNYDYPGENRSPTLVIRYDDDASSRVNTVRTEVRSYAAGVVDCEDEGRTYNFYQRGNEIFLREED